MTNTQRISKVFLIVGSILSISSICSYFFAQYMIKKNIHQNEIISNNSKAYGFWINPPTTIYRAYYLFDVRNPDEVSKGIDKPFLVERGPYVYSEVWEKRHINFLGTGLVQYYPVITLKFEESLSTGRLDDPITFLNVPAMGMIEQSTRSSSKILVPTGVNIVLNGFNETLFMTKTAGELIEGYEDPLLKLAKEFMPNLVKDDKFSLINGRNGTEWENFTMITGYDEVSDVAKLVSWNGLEKLNFWSKESANLINGTDGTFYAPYRKRDQKLYSFNPDMCRSYYLEYLKDNVIDGVKTYDFQLPKDIFYDLEDQGFCDGKCLGNGVLNISKCYGGVSGYISQPHFLNADKKFVDSVYGLKPSLDEHNFVLNFEPTTGVPIKGSIKLQIGFHTTQNDLIDIVKDIKPSLIPLFWFNEYYEIQKDTVSQLKQVALYVNLSNILPIAILSLGLTFTLTSISIMIYLRYKNGNAELNSNNINESTRLLN